MGLFKLLKKILSKNNNTATKNSYQIQNYNTNLVAQTDHKVKLSDRENYKGKELIKYEEWLLNTDETNQNGTNRQDILAKCLAGDAVTFKLFETNDGYYYLETWAEHGCIGCIHNFDTLQTVAKYIKNGGVIHNAKIEFLKQPKTSRGKISCKISFERNKMR